MTPSLFSPFFINKLSQRENRCIPVCLKASPFSFDIYSDVEDEYINVIL